MLALLSLSLVGCNVQRLPKVPGETDVHVSEVRIESATDKPLALDHGEFPNRLGVRPPSLVFPERYYNPFRVAEDHRRLTAHWERFGYFDVQVSEAEERWASDRTSVAIEWKVNEGPRYKVASVHLQNVSGTEDESLRSLVPFEAGTDDVDLEKFRNVRNEMGTKLRKAGYAHAMVYSRVYVDREKKELHWYYFIDVGPSTKVGTVSVDGNARTDAEAIRHRAGLESGSPYSSLDRESAEWYLLDTGDFASAFVRSQVDVKFIVPGTAPDSGGELRDEQIDADGNLVPRKLPEAVDLQIHVVEAPKRQVKLRASVEADPSRIDVSAGGQVWLRDLLGPWRHITMEGRFGHGWLLGTVRDDPSGFYGDAALRSVNPSLLGRRVDFRSTVRFADELYPGFHLRELVAGPGLRTAFTPSLFLDVDFYFRFGQQVGFGPFDAETRDRFRLASRNDSLGGVLEAGLVWDARDNRVEPMAGHMVALRTQVAPGGALGTHSYGSLAPDLRGYVPMASSLSLALRASGGWVIGDRETGVPLGPRLFGGGAYGMRGFGRQRLAPTAPACEPNDAGDRSCKDVVVGGLSLAETSAEVRYLPYLKPYGAVGFVDLGGASVQANPFGEGASLATGVGLRLRFWYLPMALDGSFRVMEQGRWQALDQGRGYSVFFRIGEAY